MLTRVGTSALGVSNLMGFWKLVIGITHMLDGFISLNSIQNYPLYELQAFITERMAPERQMEFLNLYDRVAEKMDEAQLVMNELNEIPFDNPQNMPLYSLTDVIDGGGMACIDIVSDNNTFYKELCFIEIEKLIRSGRRFVLITENIKVLADDNAYTDKVLLNNNAHVTRVFGAEDVHAAVRSKTELFQRLSSGNCNAVVFRHNSAQSAKQWEEYFGQYYHVAADVNITKSNETFKFFSQTHSKSVTAKQELRSVIPTRMIMEQDEGQAIVKTSGGDLWFVLA